MDQRIQRDDESSDLGCGQQEIQEWLCPDDCRVLRVDVCSLKRNRLPAFPHTPRPPQMNVALAYFSFSSSKELCTILINFKAK